jgi:hypothetical protein
MLVWGKCICFGRYWLCKVWVTRESTVLAYKYAGVIAKRAINTAREIPERGDMSRPRAGAYIACEEDTKSGEMEIALCMLGSLGAAEDADTAAVGVIGEVVGGGRVGEELSRDRDIRGFKFCTRLRHKHMTHHTPLRRTSLKVYPVAVSLPDMSGSLSTNVCLPLVGKFGRRAPSSESQSSMSLICPPILNRGSIEPTSKRRHSPIYILNNDALLNIFYLYCLHVQDEYEGEDGIRKLSWKRQRWWYKLAQVSRRWRYLILASRSALDLHLLCTYGVPVAVMLGLSPPLPFTIFYDGDRTMTAEDEHAGRTSRTFSL